MSKGNCQVCGRKIPENSPWDDFCDDICLRVHNMGRHVDIHEIVRRVREEQPEDGGAKMPTTRQEIEAQMRALREKRKQLDLKLTYNRKQVEAVQALCDHPETYFTNPQGRWPSNTCCVCGKSDVRAAEAKESEG